uniref:RING-type domain-containing protein n=1 Tax=Caenorhabditis tropicalis TaxID=1561998 RepID=A0A1I7UM21_9PELO
MNYNETTKVAHSLHCGHTFCKACIKNIQEYGNSAYLECPTCRSETKCKVEDVAQNFLVMEMIRNLKMMGPAEAVPVKEPKLARGAQRERTIDEMVDQKYRHLIADVKGELMAKFDDMRESLRKSTIHSVQSELDTLSDNVLEAVRDANYETSESEFEEETDEHDIDSQSMISTSTAYSMSSLPIADESTFIVRNPVDSTSEFSDEEESDSESNDTDSNDGSSEMSDKTSHISSDSE